MDILKKGRFAALISLLIALFIQYSDPSFLKNFRHRVFDIYQQSHSRLSEQPRKVTVIDIDERSLLELGQWPWPRHLLAKLVDNANEMGAKVIGFDMLFAEKDRLSPENIIETFPNFPKNVIEDLKTRQSFDTLFAKAIGRHQVILGIAVSEDPSGANNYGYSSTANFVKIGADPTPYLREYPALIGNIPKLDDTAAGRGMISLDQDFDGIVRRIPLANRIGTKLLPSLSLDMLRVATNQNVVIKTSKYGIEGFIIGGAFLPTDLNGRIWVKYSRFDPKRYISAYDLISGSVDPKLITDQYLLVGTSATGLKDLRSTPLDSALPGVEVHAQLLENVLEQSFLFRADYFHVLEWAGTFATGMILIILVPVVGARLTLGVFLLVSGIAISSTAYLFIKHSILLDVSYTLAVSSGIYLLLVYASYLSTEQERTRIRSAFSQYLSPDLVKRLTASPEQLVLGGEQKEMTFLFCDIRDFTGISETFRNDPQALTQLINDFLTPMTDQILQHEGTIDKYMGDSIMAFWNAPLDDPNHSKNAVDAALTMMKTLQSVNRTLKERADAEGYAHRNLKIGIGVNTGTCIVGNLGSEQRFDYSVIGDAVNLASRLEGQSKSYGVDIIIGEETAGKVEEYALLELDSIAVKGRMAATKIYGVMGDSSIHGSAEFQRYNEDVKELLVKYRAKKWQDATKIAVSLKETEPTLSIFCDLYLQRIGEFIETPPPENWDGVFRAISK